jgi:putative hydrolase
VVRNLPPSEIAERAEAGTLKELDGIGDATARVIQEALRGEHSYLDKIDAETRLVMSPATADFRQALRGDLHMHTRWSDGGAELEAMVEAARAIGHEYIVITDHSPRLTVAHGLDRARLERQMAEIDVLRSRVAPFRLLTGIEVDILEDGTLDQDDDLLAELDIVIASVHSKLSMEQTKMTERMVRAIGNPHVDVLGHCTGRMIGKRSASSFDADFVFAGCAAFGTAVEINCRPERLDPPRPLLDMAIEYGCLFAVNSDAHSTGQLEWQPRGCERAVERGVPLDRVINSWSAERLLDWAGSK